MKVTAAMARAIPTIMLVVIASPKTTAPTRIAVTGSKTPSTDALVAPILRVARANVAVETIVGSIASPTRFSHADGHSIPVVIELLSVNALPRNMNVPVKSE